MDAEEFVRECEQFIDTLRVQEPDLFETRLNDERVNCLLQFVEQLGKKLALDPNTLAALSNRGNEGGVLRQIVTKAKKYCDEEDGASGAYFLAKLLSDD